MIIIPALDICMHILRTFSGPDMVRKAGLGDVTCGKHLLFRSCLYLNGISHTEIVTALGSSENPILCLRLEIRNCHQLQFSGHFLSRTESIHQTGRHLFLPVLRVVGAIPCKTFSIACRNRKGYVSCISTNKFHLDLRQYCLLLFFLITRRDSQKHRRQCRNAFKKIHFHNLLSCCLNKCSKSTE